MNAFAIALLITVLCGCSTTLTERPDFERPFSSLTEEELNICEAVFRYQFQHNASGQQEGAKAYFIELFGNDPSDAYLKRFADVVPPVKRGSLFRKGHGLAFSIYDLKMVGNDDAEVGGGYYEAELSASGNTYFLKRKEGKWVCERNVRHWISGAGQPNPYQARAVNRIQATPVCAFLFALAPMPGAPNPSRWAA